MSGAADDHIMHDLRKAKMRPYMTGNVTSGARPLNGGLHYEH